MMGEHDLTVRNVNLPHSPEAFRQICSRCVVEDGRLLEAARILSNSENCTDEVAEIFRDALDQFLALYYSTGEANLALDLIHSRAPHVFTVVRRSLGQLVCLGKPMRAADPAAGTPIPSWDNQTAHVLVSWILANRRLVLLWHLTGKAREWHKPVPLGPGITRAF